VSAGNFGLNRRSNLLTSEIELNGSKIWANSEYQSHREFHKFIKRGRTQNFDTGQKNHEALKLVGFLRHDFDFKSIFMFLLDCKFSLYD
jgi:hypothetical protein